VFRSAYFAIAIAVALIALVVGGAASWAQKNEEKPVTPKTTPVTRPILPAKPVLPNVPLREGVELKGLKDLQLKAEKTDQPIRVIVQYNQAAVSQGTSITAPAQMKGLGAEQLQLAHRSAGEYLAARGIKLYRPIETLPLATVEVTRSQMASLAESGQFALVVEDRLSAPNLASSGGVIGVANAHMLGARGAGTAIAILDTGVDRTHPFFGGRVVEGACFSSNVAGQGASSLCPGGVTESTALASSGACTGAAGCDHGTHVAGIAAGDGAAFDGVAPLANIMAVQVFSRFTDTPGGAMNCANFSLASPCVLTFDSDQIRGLQRVNAREAALNIVAANMSLGGGTNAGACDTDARKPIIDLLLTNGVATVISSGNSGFRGAVGTPGCISSAVTVGSTTDADAVSGFSNMSAIVDLLAPGSAIDSSVPGTGFGSKSGTSMAAPQVAGAIAALASLAPDRTINQILTTLTNTGTNVTDSRTSGTVTKRRINVGAAAAELAPQEDCIGHSVSSLTLSDRGGTGGWTIQDGTSLLFSFGSLRSEAEAALGVIRRYGFTKTCYVGRPGPSMQYLVAGGSVPTTSHGSEDCIGFNRAGLTLQSVGTQWRLTDGSSSMLMFPNNSEGQQAITAINRYRLNRQCFVGRPGPSFTYWLAD
jgi:subtilisin family serine protease